MVVMVLEKVPQSLRGELTRWLVEVKTGVYIGHVTGMVRDLLWKKCSESRGAGGVFQAWSTNNEQHFKMRISGLIGRSVVDWEGVELIQEGKEVLTKAKRSRIQ
ncbi:MAG: type I-E CRISPR-associated endoribonuclease Cas2 [Chloroflexi bacterium]|nr:type I-E CRISPR-associated endoribonuclease Cas2 [Chloroflexota bacterium]